MAKRKTVEIIIKLKDGVSGVLTKIRGGLTSVGSAFKAFGKAGLAATAVVIGGLTALAKAYSVQETANKKLKATFDAFGESGAKAVLVWGKFATEIQRATTYGDEEIMSLISFAKTMGIANKQMKEATKGAIGLSASFGIDLNSSMKMVALALQGEYTMLQRYIPQLRAATTEEEKAAIVQKAMARGFEIAKDQLDSVAGEWKALQGVIGDAMQAAGAAIFGDGGLVVGIRKIKEAIINLEESGAIERWGKKVKGVLDTVVEVIKIITKSKEGRSEVLGAVANVFKAAIIDGAHATADILKIAAPAVGKFIASGFTDAIKALNPFKRPEGQKDYVDAATKLGRSGQLEKEGFFSKSGERERNEAKIQAEIARVTAAREAKLDESIKEALSGEGTRTNKALSALSKLLKKLGDELPKAVEDGAEKGTNKGNKNPPPPPPPPPPDPDPPPLSEGLNGQDLSGSKEFIKELMKGQEGLSRKQSLGVLREVIKSGGSGQLKEVTKILESLMKGKTGLSQKDALGVIRQLLKGGGDLGDGDSITDLIDQLSKGQDAMSKSDISRALMHFFGMDADGGTMLEKGAMGGASVSAPSTASQLAITNELLQKIESNTKGGLF